MIGKIDLQAKDTEWNVRAENGSITWDRVGIAVLMDIRRELRNLNVLLHCRNCVAIPAKLDRIERNTRKRKRKA